MIMLEGIITALSPVHIGNGRSKGTFIQTLDHIPGRTIRGMLGYYLYKNDRELFDAVGIDVENDISKMGIFFKNAYPVYENEITVVSPLCFKWCKKCGTLFKSDAVECTNIIDNRRCLHEGKKYSGFMSKTSIIEKKLKKPRKPDDISKQIETKCPITRKGHTSMGSAEEGYELSPYHIESISSGSRFGSKIIVRDEFAEKVIDALKNAGAFYGLGGFRSRGYGSVRFDITGKHDLGTLIEKRAQAISLIRSKLLVMNSQMILRKDDKSLIGFNDTFIEYAEKTLTSMSVKGNIKLDTNIAKITKVSQSIARGWSYKNHNSLSELIPCTGQGSCIGISGDPLALSSLEAYGIGEMINCGYGDVYVTGDVE